MRLIDADKLGRKVWLDGSCLVMAVSEIDNAPTIEAVPVVHGKWVKYSFSCVCTQCETEFDDDDIRRMMGKGKMPNFCPECGADMRKGGE